jgi:anti-sigma-K factor RskA
VARLREGAAELAYAAEGPEPRPELRDRIVRAAREERPAPVLPLRRRWIFPATALAAVAASFAAIGLGLWANSLRNDTPTRVVAFDSGDRLVVSGTQATLVACVDPIPTTKTYEAWVIRDNRPRPAGIFSGGCHATTLDHAVQPGDVVAVTVEPGGGSKTPRGEILMSANV